MIEHRRVAVTGAGGFIGAAVCREFVRFGYAVRALVGPPGVQLATPDGVEVGISADIDDAGALRKLFDGRVDVVVHLAGPPSVSASFNDPVVYVRAHTGGTAGVLHACRQAGIGCVIYVSSAEVYGRPRTNPVDESHPIEARSPYAAAKIGAEQMVLAYHNAYGMSAAIIRPFSVYGPGMGEHTLLAAIFRQLNGTGPLLLANLLPERDYCYIDDVARAIRCAAECEMRQPLAFNIGSGIGTSVLELAGAVLRLANVERAIEEAADGGRPRSADILRLIADPSRAADVIGWRPAVSLDAGLSKMLETVSARR